MTVIVVWAKELLDTLRDRRTLVAMVIGPVLVMPVFVLLPSKLVQRQRETQEVAVIRLAVDGAASAPTLMEYLTADGEVSLSEPADVEAAVRDKDADVGLIIPAGFELDLAEGRPATVQFLVDESQMLGSQQAERVRSMLLAFEQRVVAARLEARGVDPALLEPFSITNVNVASPQQMSGAFLGMMLPMFIVLWALVGGMYTAIDVTAGEKERLTLEPLLTAPVRRLPLVAGKLLAVVTTSLVALILAIASMLFAFTVAPPVGEEIASQMSLGVEPRTALLILLAALPVVVMFSALEMAVCLMARSFKEAQNYIVPMQFVVLIPAMAVMVLPDLSPALPAFAVPIFSTLVILRDLFLGRVDVEAFAVMAGSSLLYAVLAVALAVWQFGRERVLFRV